jgi:dolichol-phosphate mannosyltransferase
MPAPDLGDRPELSLIIPVRDEEAAIPLLAEEITRVLTHGGVAWEAVWIDDGSRDSTRERLRALPAPHRFIAFDTGLGQSAAYAAGFLQAGGAWFATIDGDGQNDPADLLRLLAHARAAPVDLVIGFRTTRRDGVLRCFSSWIAKAARRLLLADGVRDIGCSTRIARPEVLTHLPFFADMHRFLPILVRMQGYQVAELPVNHRQRTSGRSKYGVFNRLGTGLVDLLGVCWLRARQRPWRIGAAAQRR